VISDADQSVGNVHRARQRHIDLPQDLQRVAAFDRAASSSLGTVLNVCRSEECRMLAMYGRPIATMVSRRPSAFIVR
jgi:hypothetical protein